MTIQDEGRLKAAWNQKTIPVALRRDGKGERVRVRLPYADDNYAWLRNGRRNRPSWNPALGCSEIPKAWFNDLVNRCLRRWGLIYVIQPYQEQEICAPACMNAIGHECQFSRMGPIMARATMAAGSRRARPSRPDGPTVSSPVVS